MYAECSAVASAVVEDVPGTAHANRISISKPELAKQFRLSNSQVVWVGGLPRCASAALLHTSDALQGSRSSAESCQDTPARITLTNHSAVSRDVESSLLEASVRQLAPHAVHVEVLSFKSTAQAAKYPPGSKVRTQPRLNPR